MCKSSVRNQGSVSESVPVPNCHGFGTLVTILSPYLVCPQKKLDSSSEGSQRDVDFLLAPPRVADPDHISECLETIYWVKNT